MDDRRPSGEVMDDERASGEVDPSETGDMEDANSNCFIVDASDGRQLWVPKCPIDRRPFIGQVFDSPDDAYNFYSSYASIAGFCVRKATSKVTDGMLRTRYFTCHRQGKKHETRPIDTLNNERPIKRVRMVTRCNCDAKMCIRVAGGNKFEVYKFEERHNHALVSNIGKQFLRVNRHLSYAQQNFIVDCGNLKIGPTRAFHIMKEMAGGYSNVGATKTDCKNFKRDMKCFIGDRDAQMLVNTLVKRKENNPTLFFEYCTDGDGKLQRLFWADSISTSDCKRFGDVVTFDATYRSNKYHMVFVPFTGIDNHKSSVNLAAGLLFSEDVQSYSWLLECFKKVISEEPKVIVTDQDPAMKIAVPSVFPNTKHRFCMWHITEKLKSKVGVAISRGTSFIKDISSVIWAPHIDIDEFEEQWNFVIKQYGLEGNKWLADIYEIRTLWIPVYMKHIRMGALIRSTSRSESENSFFGRFLHGEMTLVEFYMGFQTAIEAQRNNRLKKDEDARTSSPVFKSDHLLERHAALEFTPSIFFEFQPEILAAAYKCSIGAIGDSENKIIYTIKDTAFERTRFKVSFEQETLAANCSCLKFESTGIVCRHIFHVLFSLGIQSIPKSLISDRWRKESRLGVLMADEKALASSTSSVNSETISQIWYVVRTALSNAKDDPEKIQHILNGFRVVAEEVSTSGPNANVRSKADFFEAAIGIPQPEEVNINNPPMARNKGCGKRISSTREMMTKKSQKPLRLCRSCNTLSHHDSRNCPKKVADTTD